MRKLVFLSLLFFVIANAFGQVELWNGFTTSMSVDDVIARANDILAPKKIETHESSRALNATTPSYDNIGYPSPLYEVEVSSTLEAYSDYASIRMSFYNGKLFSISIPWRYSTAQDRLDGTLVKIAILEYGEPNESFRIAPWGSPIDVYYWNLPGKDFYVYVADFIFIDNSVRETWAAEQRKIIAEREAAEEVQRRAEEAERLRKAADTIHF